MTRPSRQRAAAVLLVALVVLTSCSGGSDPTIVPSASEGGTTPLPADPTAQLECEREGYPCTPADVDPAVAELEGRYVDELSDMLDASSSYAEALAWILEQEGVAEAEAGDFEMTFRLAGGQPMYISDILGDDAGAASGGVSDITLARALSGPGPAVERLPPPDGSVVGVGTPRDDRQNRKRALFLDPLFPDKEAGFVDMIPQLREIPDYSHAGAITIWRGREVTPATFLDWSSYDAIFLATHGGITRGSWLLTGLYERRDQSLTRPEQCEALLAGWTEMHTRCVAVKHNMRWFLGVAVRGDFFTTAYGTDGLDNTIVYIGGCNGLNMDPMIVALGGSSSAYVSWSESTMSPWWEGATQNLLFGLLRRWPVVLATTALCNEDMGCVVPDTGAQFGVFDNGSEADRLTLYDVPSLLDPESRVRLMDGARIEAFGAPGDGTNDNLRIVVSLIGIVDPALTSLDSIDVANLYNLRFFIDGQDVGSDNLGSPQGVGAGTTFLGDATYEYSFIAELPFDVDPDGTETTLRVAVDLAEGGTSEYEVDVAVDILCPSTPNGVIVPFELPPDALYQGSAGADALPGTDAWRVGSLEAAYDFVRAAMIDGGYGVRDVDGGQPPNEPDAKAFGMMGVGECWRGGVVFFEENSTTPPTMTIWDGRTRP